MNDPASEVSELISKQPATVRRPEKGTRPKLFYVGGDSMTVDPLAAYSVGAFPTVAAENEHSGRPKCLHLHQ